MENFFRFLDRLVSSRHTAKVITAVRHLINLGFPNPCALCVWSDAQQHHLCTVCQTIFKDQSKQTIQVQDFAEALPLNMLTLTPLPVFAGSYYTPEISKILLKYKDHQRIGIAQALRPIMYRTLTHAMEVLQTQRCLLVPIPATASSMRQRGYNPVTTMFPKRLPVGSRPAHNLLKTRFQLFEHAAHKGGTIQDRREMARHKFRLKHRHIAPAEPILLVDDVLTTGATLAAATRILEAAGFDVIGAVVFSAVQPRR